MAARMVGAGLVCCGAIVTGSVFWLVSSVSHALPSAGRYGFLVEYLPLPHHVPQFSGGLSLRFAMVQDVIHERFPRHGAAHYEARNRLTTALLAQRPEEDQERWLLQDDLAVGLERLGRSADAAQIMRDKLAEQIRQGVSGRALYTSYANLGTFLIHAHAANALAGDADAVTRFREGVEFVRKSVDVNPEAHFGRERWQTAIAEFLLASAENPELLQTFDCLGNHLDLDSESILNREANWTETGYGRPTTAAFSQGREAEEHVPTFFQSDFDPGSPAMWSPAKDIRQYITPIGAEDGWEQVPVPSHRTPVPFDEPVLGIIGMWRQGGGANPHFALALAETMLRVGQRYLAWSGFERASRLSERFSGDPRLQAFLRQHCAERQQMIEQTLQNSASPDGGRPPWQQVSPPPDASTLSRLRPAFDEELRAGQQYQQDYQEYEASRLAAGARPGDDHLFDEFHARHSAIASPTGPEETFAFVRREAIAHYTDRSVRAWTRFGAGVGALLTALLVRWRQTKS